MYSRDRQTNLKQASFIPGADSNYAIDYVKSPETRAAMPSGYKEGEQMHHLVPAEIFGAFVQNLPRNEAEIVINRANELGIRVGNDPANFIGLEKLTEHLRNDLHPNTVHSFLDNIGLESAELSGENRQQFYGLLNRISGSPLKARLDALPDFVNFIAEPAIEIGRGFRPTAQGIEANKAQYAREVAEEAARERKQHNIEEAAYALGLPLKPRTGDAQGAAGGKDLTNLLKALKTVDAVFKETGAGDLNVTFN